MSVLNVDLSFWIAKSHEENEIKIKFCFIEYLKSNLVLVLYINSPKKVLPHQEKKCSTSQTEDTKKIILFAWSYALEC